MSRKRESCVRGAGWVVPWRRWKYYGLLFIVCIASFAAVCLANLQEGKSLYWFPDALALYYNFFVFEGEWLRDIATSIIQGNFSVPLYSYDLGFGADILATMGSCINDPFNLLSALCPSEYAEYAFEGITFLRFFLAAVAFSVYSFSKGNGPAATFCGAVCYTLCGFMVLWGVLRHPNFINVAVLFPLILRGADKVFEEKSPLMLIFAMGMLFFFSLYLSYMVLVVLVVYCVIKYAFSVRHRSAVDFLKLFGRFVLYLLVAALLAGITLVPFFMLLTSMDRLSVAREGGILDNFAFYWQYASNLLGATSEHRGVMIGAVPLLGIIALVVSGKTIERRTKAPWIIGLACCFVGTLLPIAGKILNGFAYSTDRWMFVWGFCAAYAVVLVLPALGNFKRKRWIAFFVGVALVVFWVIAWGWDDGSRNVAYAAALFAVCSLLMMLIGRRGCLRVGAAVLCGAAIIATSYSVVVCKGYDEGYVGEFVEGGHVRDAAHTIPLGSVLSELDANYRIDRADVYGSRNQALAQGFKGVDFYSSFYNQNVDSFRRSTGLADMHTNYIFNGLDSRLALDGIFGARYFVALDDKADRVPFGYKKIKDLGPAWSGEGFALYENENVLPLAFTYDSAVSQAEYDKLDMVSRQELLTRSCVIAGRDADEERSGGEATAKRQDIELKAGSGVRLAEGRIEVYKSDAKVTITAPGVEDAENYVVLEGFHMTSIGPSEQRRIKGLAKGADLGPADWWSELKWTPQATVKLRVSTSDSAYQARISNGWHVAYSGKSDWLVNMGYSEKKVKKYVLKFSRPGIYTYDDLYVTSQPVAPIEDNLKALLENNDASVELGCNHINLSVAEHEGDGARYVFLSIPYSSGWAATVDDRPAEILRANVGFMAFEVDDAAHEIALTYSTPGLKEGAVCSLAGLLILATLVIVRKRREPRPEKVGSLEKRKLR